MPASSGTRVRWYDDSYICLHNGEVIEGPVRVWEDPEIGMWGYTCHCGREIEHDIWSREERAERTEQYEFVSDERGSSNFYGLLVFAVVALLLIGSWSGRPGLMLGCSIAAAWLFAITVIVALFDGAGRRAREERNR